MLKVLVLGGAGFIGSHTVDLLLNKGHEVRILDSLTPPVHQNGGSTPYIPKEVEFIRGDVRDRQALERSLENVDVVFQLAAYHDYLPDFSKFLHVNTVGTALIYELIVEKRYQVQKVIVGSSQAVYGEGKYNCPVHGIQYPSLRPIAQLLQRDWELGCPLCGRKMSPLPTDESVVNPHNPYAISKYSQEMIALNLGKRYGIPTACLRCSITQGPRQSFSNAYSGICRNFTTRLLNNKPPLYMKMGNNCGIMSTCRMSLKQICWFWKRPGRIITYSMLVGTTSSAYWNTPICLRKSWVKILSPWSRGYSALAIPATLLQMRVESKLWDGRQQCLWQRSSRIISLGSVSSRMWRIIMPKQRR